MSVKTKMVRSGLLMVAVVSLIFVQACLPEDDD